jgi:hypothetical protein
MNCTNCGTPILPGNTFCMSGGTPAPAVQQSKQQ